LPDVILLDVDLPDLSGLELCRQLKAGPQTAHIPIVFCSGNDDARPRALLLGAADYFEKPPDLTQLAQRLNLLVGHQPAAKTTQIKTS
jgi:putative two-component system response regulator